MFIPVSFLNAALDFDKKTAKKFFDSGVFKVIVGIFLKRGPFFFFFFLKRKKVLGVDTVIASLSKFELPIYVTLKKISDCGAMNDI